MSAQKAGAILLMAGGMAGLVYGSLAYAAGHRDPNLAAGDSSWEESDAVIAPAWAGIVAIAAGGALLFTGRSVESSGRSAAGAGHATQARAG